MIVSEDISSIIHRIGDKFFALSGQVLLITGGTGFVGSYLLETLAALNDSILPHVCNVFVLTRNPEAFSRRMPHLAKRNDVTIMKGDVTDYQFRNFRCDYIIHAAAVTDPHFIRIDPVTSMETITRGTLNILKFAELSKIRSFLFISSGAVYGKQPPKLERMPESFLQGPDIAKSLSAYAEGKRYAEVLCSIFRDNHCISIKTARLFTFVGPYMDMNAEYAVTDFIMKCMKKEPIIIKSDGTPIRSYCYSEDLAVALWSILLNDRANEVYNVGSDEDISVIDLAGLVTSNFEYETRIIVEHQVSENTKLPLRYIPDISKLKNSLDFKLRYSNSSAIKRSVDWVRNNASN